MRSLAGVLLAVGAGLIGCGSSEVAESPYTLAPVSGDSQTVMVHDTSAPIVARLTGPGDAPQPGVAVHWTIHSGSGTVTAFDTTDANGEASTRFAAVNVIGRTTISAQALGTQGSFTVTTVAGVASQLVLVAGPDQVADTGAEVLVPLTVATTDAWGNLVPGTWVHWEVAFGGGSVSADSTKSDAHAIAKVTRKLGSATGEEVRAILPAGADTLLFHQTARWIFGTLAGGNNVSHRFTSDLWVAGDYAYTGTWGIRDAVGNVLYVWDVSSGVALADSLVLPNVQNISDDEVSADGTLLLVTAEIGTASGLYIYTLADPAHPALVGSEVLGGNGLHTGTFADIGGARYVFTAKDPGAPALLIYRIQPDSTDPIVPVASVPQPANLTIHDTFVRDGLAFVSDWNTGLRIYDVGDGRAGGSPAAPELVGAVVTNADGLSCNCTHNAWWYHDAGGGKRYVFVGQEGPASVGLNSSGDIHVVDVSDMAHPVEVAFYHRGGAGTHNFWVDESHGILYAAYYNAGVVALDVTGALHGDLASREIGHLMVGGNGNTYSWGVMLANGALWVSDMLSGFWKMNAVP